MNDQELRALVRDAVARHLGSAEPAPHATPASAVMVPLHPSHAVYVQLVNTDTRCVIEPGVECNHCNYCRSHGH